MELSEYYICLLRKGPAWAAEESPDLKGLQEQHMAHTIRPRELGKTIASGPVDDASGTRGFSIYRTATLVEARARAQSDPGVRGPFHCRPAPLADSGRKSAGA